MTRPTGRPVGRPRTKEYVTLLARVPADLAAQVKAYAGRHQQSISELIRDGLTWRMDEGDPHAALAELAAEPLHPGLTLVLRDDQDDAQDASTPMAIEGNLGVIRDIHKVLHKIEQASAGNDYGITGDDEDVIQQEEAEPAERDSVQWRRWWIMRELQTATEPLTPAHLATRLTVVAAEGLGVSLAAVKGDLTHLIKTGYVCRDTTSGAYMVQH